MRSREEIFESIDRYDAVGIEIIAIELLLDIRERLLELS